MHVLTYLFRADSFVNAYIELMVKYACRTWISVEKFWKEKKKIYLEDVKKIKNSSIFLNESRYKNKINLLIQFYVYFFYDS